MSNTTIHDVLTQEPPEISLSLQKEGGNTENHEWVTVQASDISAWKDFTFNNIAAAYGDLLGRDAPDDKGMRPRAEHFTESQCDMVNESAVDNLCQNWCERVIKTSMKECAAHLRERLDLQPAEPSFRLHARTLSCISKRDGQKKTFQPDWFIHVHPDGDIFVVGDSKLSSKWKSGWLKRTPDMKEVKEQAIWPLRQMATYCKAANTRYGFLFTPIELVAVRIHKIPGGKDKAGIEYCSIPFSNYGPTKLTVLLSLWALTMMGVNDLARAYGPRSLYLPLHAWNRKNEGSPRLINSLSGRDVSEKRLCHYYPGDKVILPHTETDFTPTTKPTPSRRNSPVVQIPPPEGYARKLRKQPTDLLPPPNASNLKPDPVPFARLKIGGRRVNHAKYPLSNVKSAGDVDTPSED